MKIINKKATFDYQLLEKFEAGINLVGAEVKAVREGHVDLSGSFVRIIGGQAQLVNAKIFPYQHARPETYNTTRTRKLLLHKKEIISLKGKMDGANLTIVPISMYTTHGLIKVELSTAKSKKKFDKKEAIKRQDIDRDIEREIKNYR
ncbi:MAG TPA: SsrA-binding protein SmpB [Candidatus Saccharimonadales bacterium]|nr:SsrA-binding protein SmpB [Candidatus Saccharimonadales bacterium]